MRPNSRRTHRRVPAVARGRREETARQGGQDRGARRGVGWRLLPDLQLRERAPPLRRVRRSKRRYLRIDGLWCTSGPGLGIGLAQMLGGWLVWV